MPRRVRQRRRAPRRRNIRRPLGTRESSTRLLVYSGTVDSNKTLAFGVLNYNVESSFIKYKILKVSFKLVSVSGPTTCQPSIRYNNDEKFPGAIQLVTNLPRRTTITPPRGSEPFESEGSTSYHAAWITNSGTNPVYYHVSILVKMYIGLEPVTYSNVEEVLTAFDKLSLESLQGPLIKATSIERRNSLIGNTTPDLVNLYASSGLTRSESTLF